MKTLLLVVLMTLPGVLCVSQTPANKNAAPGVVVVESGWRKVSAKRNPALDDDPLGSLENQDRSERIRNKVIEQNRNNAALGRDEQPLPSRNASPPVQISIGSGHPFNYVYRVKITNSGSKKIREIVWEYVFAHPSSGDEVEPYRFTSKVSLGVGKSKTLYARSSLPPPKIVDASGAGQQPEGQPLEHVVIKKIVYDDNTFWELSMVDPT